MEMKIICDEAEWGLGRFFDSYIYAIFHQKIDVLVEFNPIPHRPWNALVSLAGEGTFERSIIIDTSNMGNFKSRWNIPCDVSWESLQIDDLPICHCVQMLRYIYALFHLANIRLSEENTKDAFTSPSGFMFLFRLVWSGFILNCFIPHNLPAEVHKYFIYILPFSGRGFVEWYSAPGLGQPDGSISGNCTVLLQIRFVTHNHEGNRIGLFNSKDLVAQVGEFV